MIAEISAIIAGVNAATSAIKSVAESTNDIQSIAGSSQVWEVLRCNYNVPRMKAS